MSIDLESLSYVKLGHRTVRLEYIYIPTTAIINNLYNTKLYDKEA